MTLRTMEVQAHDLLLACHTLVKQGMRLLTMVGSDERACGDGFVLRYVFGGGAGIPMVIVTCHVPEEDLTFASITPAVPAAAWHEREVHDLFGMEPLKHPDLRPLVLHDDWPPGTYPLRKDYALEHVPERTATSPWTYPIVRGAGVSEIPVGPIHAGIIEPGHFRFQVMGDSVLHLEARLFYTHRGIEKRAEGLSAEEGLSLSEQICGVCSASHALSYVQAVEAAAGVTAPPRARYLRTLVAELERLYNHIGDIGNLCAGVGFAHGVSYGATIKEQLMQLNAVISGHRFLRGTMAVGGVAHDVTGEPLRMIADVVGAVRGQVRQLVDDILSHDVARNRFQQTGVLSHQVAQDLAVVGPAARASGVAIDARRDAPYAAYPNLSFVVPVLESGDVLARFQIRALEVEQSFLLIQQVLDDLPAGQVCVEVGEIPEGAYGLGITESPRGENVHFVMFGRNGRIDRYRIRSASYANWPAVPQCVPGNIVADFPLINKSFELCYSCCDR